MERPNKATKWYRMMHAVQLVPHLTEQCVSAQALKGFKRTHCCKHISPSIKAQPLCVSGPWQELLAAHFERVVSISAGKEMWGSLGQLTPLPSGNAASLPEL